MQTPRFLVLEEVVAIHRDQLQRYGGHEGIRDASALSSAVAMPAMGAGGEYFHVDLFEMAAAYLFHIVKNHPFIDGNKRAGTAAALVFLDLNGIEVRAPSDALAETVLGVAEGRIAKSAVVEFLRRHGAARRRP